MSINLDAVPDKNPSAPIDEGTYLATVTKTKMSQPNDINKGEYLHVEYSVEGTDGSKGAFSDNHYDSDSSYLQFKLKRFLTALDLQLTGEIELKDIEKLVQVGSKLVLVVRHSTSEWKGVKKTDAEIDIFGSDCFYPVSDWAKFKGDADDPFTQANETESTDTNTTSY